MLLSISNFLHSCTSATLSFVSIVRQIYLSVKHINNVGKKKIKSGLNEIHKIHRRNKCKLLTVFLLTFSLYSVSKYRKIILDVIIKFLETLYILIISIVVILKENTQVTTCNNLTCNNLNSYEN